MPSKSVLIAQAFSKTGVLSTVVDSAPSVNTGQVDVATSADLPDTGNTEGDFAFVQATSRLYIWNGSGWYNIALINTTPTWDSGGQPAGAYVLDADSPQTATVITLAASDPEGLPISYNYITSGSMDSIATVSQDSSVFTITPKNETQAPDGGTGSITFRATDGVNILPQVSNFTLAFSQSWTQLFSNNNISFANGSTRGSSSSGVLAFSTSDTNFSGGSQSYRYWRFDITDLRGDSTQSDTQMVSLHLRNCSSILSWGLGNTSTTPNQVSECIMHRTDTGAVLNVSQYNRGNDNGTYEHAIVKGLSTASTNTKFYFGLAGIGNGNSPNYTFIIDAQSAVTATGFNYYVGDDVPDRDPKGFTVYGSNFSADFS